LDAFAFVVFAVLIFVGVIILSIWANFQVSSRKNEIIRRLVGARRFSPSRN